MAYRRRQGGIVKSSTFKEDMYPPPPEAAEPTPSSSSSSTSSLAAQAIVASSAHRDSSHSSAYTDSHSQGGPTYDYASMGSSNEAGSFWGILARKAKAILDDDNNVPYHSEYFVPTQSDIRNDSLKLNQGENSKRLDNPTLRKKLDAITSSMNRIGDTIGNALEEGRTIVENRAADIIQETRKMQIRRKGNNNEGGTGQFSMQSPSHTSQEDLLKASRDVAMATAAKAKLLLRELKTVKADLAFAKQRCSQLEEENKILREAREKGVNPADDDMIRLQLETLLAEKARLANDNSVYARENRFLREIVEYHQLTMQDVVYLDEGFEEVTQVCPLVSRMLSEGPSPTMSRNSSTNNLSRTSSLADFISLPTPKAE